MGRMNSRSTEIVNDTVDETLSDSLEGNTMDTDFFDDDDFATDEVEDSAEATEPEPVETPVEEVPDITSFIELVESLVSRDEENDVAEANAEQIVSVQQAYRALSRKEKNLAKNELSSRMEKAVMEDDDISLAKFYLDINNRMTEAVKVAKVPAEKKVADPTEAYVKLIAKLNLARALVVVPDEFDKEDIEKRADELFRKGAEDAQKDEQELVWVRQALNLAQPKRAKAATGGGKRHSVANHIAEAFANAEPGESLTVTQIADFKSEEYGDTHPSRQAVIAHLSSKKFKAASSVEVSENDEGEPVLVKK